MSFCKQFNYDRVRSTKIKCPLAASEEIGSQKTSAEEKQPRGGGGRRGQEVTDRRGEVLQT